MKPFVLFTVALVTSIALADSVRLSWDASPSVGVAGYRLFYGTNSASYPFTIDVGAVQTQRVELPQRGRWYFAVTAYDTNGIESTFSDEVQYEARPEPPIIHAAPLVRLVPILERSTNLVNWSSFAGEPTFIEATNAAEFLRSARLTIEHVKQVTP